MRFLSNGQHAFMTSENDTKAFGNKMKMRKTKLYKLSTFSILAFEHIFCKCGNEGRQIKKI